MKKTIPILLIIIAILFVAVLYLLYLNFYKSSVPAPITGVLPIEETTPTIVDETADWKTYTNSKYNFSIKYPQNWNLRGFGGDQNLPEDYDSFVLEGPYRDVETQQNDPNFSIQVTTSTTKPTQSSSTDFLVSVKNNNKYFIEFKLSSPKIPPEDIINNQVFNQILSTFKFTSPDYLLEDVSTYKVIDNPLSWDNCGAEDNSISLNLKQKISALVQVSEKEINGLKIISTITLGFTPADIKQFRICQAGAFSPLKVFSNRILWISSCGTGVDSVGVEKCEETRTTIQNLYN